jgi:hypothetical protein
LLCPSDIEILKNTIVVVKKLPDWTDITPAGIAYSRKLERPHIIVCVGDSIPEVIFRDVFGPAVEALAQKIRYPVPLISKENMYDLRGQN